jgi:hypothetical protein
METEVQPAPETGAGNDDVRADVLAAFKAHEAPTETDMRLPSEAPEPAAADDAEPASPQERARNERGQFIKADGTVDTEAEAARVPDADPDTATPEKPSTAPSEMPTSWSADAKAEWSKLSPAVQQAVLKRETEINEGGRRWSEEKRTYDEVLSPLQRIASASGLDPREGLQRLLNVEYRLRTEPDVMIAELAEAYGARLNKPQGEPTPQPQPAADPRITQLHQTVTSLQQEAHARKLADANSAIATVSKDKPHWAEVENDLPRFLTIVNQSKPNASHADKLQEAYDMAVWANPATREKLIAAQTAAATKTAAERAQADKARRGAISTNGSPVASGASIPKQDYETAHDAARAAWAQHTG